MGIRGYRDHASEHWWQLQQVRGAVVEWQCQHRRRVSEPLNDPGKWIMRGFVVRLAYAGVQVASRRPRCPGMPGERVACERYHN